MEEQCKCSAVEYLDWYFKYDDGGADKTAVEAWDTIKTVLDELRSTIKELQSNNADLFCADGERRDE